MFTLKKMKPFFSTVPRKDPLAAINLIMKNNISVCEILSGFRILALPWAHLLPVLEPQSTLPSMKLLCLHDSNTNFLK
jgi:hypothetical protein